LDQVTGNQADSTTVVYRRHEPIPPPRLSDPGPFAPGAAIDRMVVRSDKNLTPEQLHAQDPDYPLVEMRTLHPPTASLQVAEQHGRLDPPMSDERSFGLAQRAMAADTGGAGLPDPAAEGVNAVIHPEPGGLTHEISADAEWRPDWPDPLAKTIELRPHASEPDPVTLDWSENTLRVTLGKAEQATIALSSTIPGDMLDHLAVSDYLSIPLLPPEQTLLGRNPVITPPRRVLVVHAVRTPLAEPRWNALAVDRQPDATEALLTATFTAAESGFGLHTDSTGRLEVAASWTEVEDVGDQATIGSRPVTVAQVHGQSIDRGDPPPIQIRHEFGDTHYRAVTYTVKATSRFREYFKNTEPEDAFQSSHTHDPLDLLSTVRPPAPVVLGVVPGFAWQRSQPSADRIEHVRSAQRLRVELARPWFQTGAGEQLAVVLAPTDADAATAGEWFTRIGRDPLFATPATGPRPAPDWFTNTAAAQQLTLPEANNMPVTVIPVDVTPAGDRWYGDVAFTGPATSASYNPLVRLAVARYQPHTLTDTVPLSPVVVTDTVPLLPDRHVIVTRSGNQLAISVDGISPKPLNQLEAILEACEPGIPPEDLDIAVDDAATEPELAAWRPVTRVERRPDKSIPPLTLATTAGRQRVRLRETENIPGIDPDAPPDLARRTVFVDTIVLPEGWQPT
ncbi:MAG: hypothetical protein JWO67_4590, partial [Streptosporangiaceae bacterium]|nr:hypothetical protein [Streptosporangiaceae bacterium]